MTKKLAVLLILVNALAGCSSIEYECGRAVAATNCENIKQADVNEYYDQLSKANWACIEAGDIESARKRADCMEAAKKGYCGALSKEDKVDAKRIFDSCR